MTRRSRARSPRRQQAVPSRLRQSRVRRLRSPARAHRNLALPHRSPVRMAPNRIPTTSHALADPAPETTPTHPRREWDGHAAGTTRLPRSRAAAVASAPVTTVRGTGRAVAVRPRQVRAHVHPRHVRVSPACCRASVHRAPARVAAVPVAAAVVPVAAVPAVSQLLVPVAAVVVAAVAVAAAPLVHSAAAVASPSRASRSGRNGQNLKCGRHRQLAV